MVLVAITWYSNDERWSTDVLCIVKKHEKDDETVSGNRPLMLLFMGT
jgi:hypothetical protein